MKTAFIGVTVNPTYSVMEGYQILGAFGMAALFYGLAISALLKGSFYRTASHTPPYTKGRTVLRSHEPSTFWFAVIWKIVVATGFLAAAISSL
ncbi:hypothetical protein OAH15_00725 [bacterium]|nr:hypothetical protein [bacterium]